jgi:hypothetical protein
MRQQDRLTSIVDTRICNNNQCKKECATAYCGLCARLMGIVLFNRVVGHGILKVVGGRLGISIYSKLGGKLDLCRNIIRRANSGTRVWNRKERLPRGFLAQRNCAGFSMLSSALKMMRIAMKTLILS